MILEKHKKWIILLTIIIVIVFCAFFFRVKKVTIEGNTYYGTEKMVEMYQSNIFQKNILTFWLMEKLSLNPDVPFVREYEVTYPTVNEIHIVLYEKKIVAGIDYSKKYIYFDKDGTVLRSTDKPIEGIPLFETETMTNFTLYQKVQMEDESLLQQIMNLSTTFQENKLTWDKVVFNKQKEATLYIGDLEILLGKRDNYDESVYALANIVETASQKGKRTIDLSRYQVGDTIYGGTK